MLIKLYTDEILHDIYTKSSIECQAIADAQERYRVQAGTDKRDELVRQMIIVQASLKRMMHRWLDDTGRCADDTLAMPESFEFHLKMTERRAANKVQPLTDACHSYMVSYVLARYYASVGAKDLSNAYSITTAEHAQGIEELLNSKLPPL